MNQLTFTEQMLQTSEDITSNKMAYYEQCLNFINQNGKITAMDVHKITGTTSSHKVIQALVVKKIIDEGEWQKAPSGKRYKVHRRI